MNFRSRATPDDSPEINLIPLIDVLLVILIFLAATTSFQRQQWLAVDLPQAQTQDVQDGALHLSIDARGRYALARQWLDEGTGTALADVLRGAAEGQDDPLLVVHADAQAPHGAVVRAMDAARLAGIGRLAFATQPGP